jgi:hemerythrin-like metal-binding protein
MIYLLYDYTIYHFDEEEKLLKSMGFKLSVDHIFQHEEFKKKIADFRQKFSAGRMAVTYEIMNFLRTWLVDHLLGTDREYVEMFTNQETTHTQKNY